MPVSSVPAPFAGYRPASSTETITRSSEYSSDYRQTSLPQSVLNAPVAAVIGRKRVPDANVIWAGNFRPLISHQISRTQTQEQKDNGDGTKETITTTKTTTTISVVGYLVDLHYGICLGPDVILKAIYVDNIMVWSGSVGPARTVFNIPTNNTFISGAQCVFSGGAFDQAPEPLVAAIVPAYTGYVGIATILIQNLRVDLPMGNISFEVVRVPNPLGLSDAENRVNDDVNVVSATVEVLTQEWGWGGLSMSSIDTAKFTTMAQYVIGEGNVVSMKVGQEVSLPSVAKALQDQADVYLFQDPETGLVTGSLFRQALIDYVAFGKRYYDANISDVQNYNKSYWPDTVDQARGAYTERDADYNEAAVFVRNPASTSVTGRGLRTTNFNYPYIPTRSLCEFITARDLSKIATPFYEFQITTNRDGADRLPGDFITVTWPKFKILNLPVLVTKVRKQPDDRVVLWVRQISFPVIPLVGGAGPIYQVDFDVDAKTPTSVKFLTAPYYIARGGMGTDTSQVSPVVYPMILPTPANGMQFSFNAYINNVPGETGPVVSMTNASYATAGLLNGAIGLYDDIADGTITSVLVDNIVNPSYLESVGNAGVRAGKLFLIIGDEILSFESVTNNGGGSWTLSNVHRALLDTVPQAHADNDPIYIVGDNFNYISSGFTYPIGYVPQWKLTSNTLTDSDDIGQALTSSDWVPSNVRTLAPPRPHNTKVNGLRRQEPITMSVGESITVTWSTRSRVPADVRLTLDAADSPEFSGSQTQKHVVYHRSSGGTYTACNVALVGNTVTFNLPSVSLGIGSILVRSQMVLGGVMYESIYEERLPVEVVPAPTRITEDLIARATEAGDIREIE